VGRFGDLPGDGLIGAVRDWYDCWGRHGLEAREVVSSDVLSPNAAVCPRVTTRRLEAAGTWVAGAAVETDADALRPWLTHPSWKRDVVPVCDTPASMGHSDPLTFLLYRLGLAHGWEFVGRRAVPGPVEAGYAPRVELPSGTVLSPARWWLEAPHVSELATLDGPERYMAWRDHAERLGLPRAVWVVTDPALEAIPSYLATSSPISVDALFDRVQVEELEFFEVHGDCDTQVCVDEAGRRYACEVAVVWRDDTYWPRVRPA
jgi:hypothetical protein